MLRSNRCKLVNYFDARIFDRKWLSNWISLTLILFPAVLSEPDIWGAVMSSGQLKSSSDALYGSGSNPSSIYLCIRGYFSFCNLLCFLSSSNINSCQNSMVISSTHLFWEKQLQSFTYETSNFCHIDTSTVQSNTNADNENQW